MKNLLYLHNATDKNDSMHNGAGSTFFFVDLDYSPKVYGAGRKQNSYS
jgi:hypothetical protein